MSDNEGPMLGMFAGSGATWHISALRVGELMAENGPDGYYEMTAEAWCTWACSQARLLRAETRLSGHDYDNLVRDAMLWRARFTAPDVVPRSRLDAVEVELATAEQRIKHVQEAAHKHITEVESLFEHATGYSFDGYKAMRDEVRETATPWADLQMRVPDNNCLLEGSRGPQCRYCGEVYASPNSDDGHSRNCNRPARYRKP